MNARYLPTAIVLFAVVLSQSACMKTRSQIRGNDAPEESYGSANEGEAPARNTRYEVEEMKNELTRVSGKLEVLEHQQRNQNAMELKEYASRLDARIAELEKNQVLVMTELKTLKESRGSVSSGSARGRSAGTDTSSAQDLLVEGNQFLADNNYEEAGEKFRAYLSQNPKGKNAAEGHFGLGESEYGLKNYKKAIVQFSKVQEQSSKSPKIAASLYKIGLSFQHLNMSKESQGFFKELIERYPKSPEAKKAKSKIKE